MTPDRAGSPPIASKRPRGFGWLLATIWAIWLIVFLGCLQKRAVEAPIKVEAPVTATAEVKAELSAQIAWMATRIEKLESEITVGGGTDSIFSWILATSVGLSVLVTALGIGFYIVSHRIPALRHAWDRAKGKTTVSVEAPLADSGGEVVSVEAPLTDTAEVSGATVEAGGRQAGLQAESGAGTPPRQPNRGRDRRR